jgi:hypothetical protein
LIDPGSELVEQLGQQCGFLVREVRAQTAIVAHGDLAKPCEQRLAGGGQRDLLNTPVVGLPPAADESLFLERVEVVGEVASVMPIASAMRDWVPHCQERTSKSTCHADAEPPASAIARSNALATTRAVRVRRNPIGGSRGGPLTDS